MTERHETSVESAPSSVAKFVDSELPDLDVAETTEGKALKAWIRQRQFF